MKPPFTQEQFFEVFKNYNESVFPVQFVFYFLSFIAIYLTLKPNSNSGKVISIILSFFWLWMGVVYHLIFFTAINSLAYVFGVLFILQSILFLIFGVFQNKLSFKFQIDQYSVTGVVLILFSVIIYPVSGYLLGHVYPYSPTFGLPCPTTIFTFGLLLMNIKKCPVIILIIPIIWAVTGFSAAFIFGIAEDTGLPVAAIITLFMLLKRNRMLSATDI